MRGILKGPMAGAQSRWRQVRASFFWQGWPLWIWPLVAAALMFGPFHFPATLLGVPIELADRLRWSGMLFQFAGLAMVVVGLNLSRQIFEQSSIRKAIVAWLGRARYMVVPPKAVTATMNIREAGLDGFSAEGTLSVRKGASIESRVAKLEDDLKRLDGNLAETKQDLRNLRSETNEKTTKSAARGIQMIKRSASGSKPPRLVVSI
jgi:hypothetical protein